MTDTNTDPVIETSSLSDILTGASHEGHQEAGFEAPSAAPAEAPAPPPPAAPPPAPVAETPPPAAAPAAAAEEKTPYWYRQALKKDREQLDAAQRRAEAAERELQAARGAPPAPAAAPDPYEDPAGYTERFNQEIARVRHEQNVAVSERFARLKHGDQAWEDTQEWLRARPDMVQWARGQSDPCEAAIQQYKREQLVDEIGTDPAAYREKVQQELRESLLKDPEVRASILAEMGVVPAAQAPQTQRTPPPPAASTTRSAAPRAGDRASTGPTPMGNLLNKFK